MAKIFAEPLHNTDLTVAGKGWQFDYVPNTAGSLNIRDADSFSAAYDAATNSYLVSAPGSGSGTLYQVGGDSYDPLGRVFPAVAASSATAAAEASSTMLMRTANQANSEYTYTALVEFWGDEPATGGLRTATWGVFGIAQPTRASEVPTTGTARYNGYLFGTFAGDAGATWLEGTARFDFDFALAQLGGDLTVSMRCMMGCAYDDVSYNLANTQFAPGSTTFSGNLALSGAPSNGSFSGLFAGPGAIEMMSQFQLPFFNPEYQRWMTAGGVILGKRE